jgi:hypothetical protein
MSPGKVILASVCLARVTVGIHISYVSIHTVRHFAPDNRMIVKAMIMAGGGKLSLMWIPSHDGRVWYMEKSTLDLPSLECETFFKEGYCLTPTSVDAWFNLSIVVSPVKHSTNVPYSSPDERHH